MNIETSIEKSAIPFGIYRINKTYLKHFKTQNPYLFNPEQTLYCGSVLTDYSVKHNRYVDFFVPIIQKIDYPELYKFNGTVDAVINGVFGELDFRRMIPCTERFLTIEENETERLDFYIKERKMLETIAKQVHDN